MVFPLLDAENLEPGLSRFHVAIGIYRGRAWRIVTLGDKAATIVLDAGPL
jgi:hypothetical protein